MKCTTVSWMFAVVFSLGATAVRADDASDIKAIKSQYAKIAAAFVHKDLDALGTLLTEDFTATMSGQSPMSRKQVMANDKAEMAQWIGTPDVQIQCHKATIKDSTAITAASLTGNVTFRDTGGQYGPKGKTHRLRLIGNTSDTWVRTASGWLCKEEGIRSQQIWIDGKPFHPKPAPTKGK